MTYTRATSLNAAALICNYFVTIVAGFVVNPQLCRLLGISAFGVWQICLRLLTFVSAADGRASQALKWTVANKCESDSTEPCQRDIGSALIVWLLFSPVMCALGLLLVWLSPRLMHGLPSSQYLTVRLTCLVLVLNAILLPLQSIPQAVMTGVNRAYRCVWVDAVKTLLYVSLMIVLAYAGYGLVGLAGAAVVSTVFAGIAGVIVARRSLSWFRVKWPNSVELKSFAGFSIWVFAWALLNKLMLCMDIVLLGLLSSTTLVASYTMSNYAAQTAINLAALGVSAGMPGLGSLIGRDERHKAAAVRQEIVTICWLIVAVGGSMILVLNHAFVSLWVGPECYVGHFENLMIVLLMAQLILIRSDAFIIDVTLNMRDKVLLGYASSALAVLLGYLLGRWMKSTVVGVTCGLLGGRLLLSICYPILIKRFLGCQQQHGMSSGFRMASATAVLFASSSLLGKYITLTSWPAMIGAGFALVSLLIPLAFWLGIPRQSRETLLQRLSYVPLLSNRGHSVRQMS